MRPRRISALLLSAILSSAGCTPSDRVPSNVVRIAWVGDATAALDPQREVYAASAALFACCLLRTLFAVNRVQRSGEISQVLPDLATSLPEPSADGLTWTFRIREGLRYAPPFEGTEIVASDFVRALERTADPEIGLQGPAARLLSPIEGFESFSAGDAPSIEGLEVVDDYTLIVRLNQPEPNLPYLFTFAATAPLPEGAAEDREKDYGRFLVASGPYMFEGSDQLEPLAPPAEQMPVSGYDPGRSAVLVRNPSWERESDSLREAHVDRIEIEFGGNLDDLALELEAGEIDAIFDTPPPASLVAKYQRDAQLRDQVQVGATAGERFISLNLAEPPLDDVHVRRAVNLAIDKRALQRIVGGEAFGDIAGHVVPDPLLDGRLQGWDPYETPDHEGDRELAMAEMRRSSYDSDRDGICDADVCRGVLTLTESGSPWGEQAAVIEEDLRALGITLELRSLQRDAVLDRCLDPGEHVAMCLRMNAVFDNVDAFPYFQLLYMSDAIAPAGCCNISMVGATPAVLREHGYVPREIPALDPAIERCEARVGESRLTCWERLARHVTVEVVPQVPVLYPNHVNIVSDRIADYAYDGAYMSLDQIRIVDPNS